MSTENQKSNHRVIAAHHSENVTTEKLEKILLKKSSSRFGKWFNKDIKIFINSTGRLCWVDRRPMRADRAVKLLLILTEVTPACGGAFSGKCVTKVDRSAAYVARYIAKKYCGC